MNQSKGKISVVGAGFTGLVSAYYLHRAGFEVEVFEASRRVGGLIDTVETDFGRIELGANGILFSDRVNEIFKAARVPLIEAGKNGKKRYFYRNGRPVRWPLSVVETFALLAKLSRLKGKAPRDNETVEAWALRAIGEVPYRHLLAPALQGIYAGDPKEMSAKLVLRRLFEGEKVRTKGSRLKGVTPLVAPAGGMHALLHGLHRLLEEKGVRFRLGKAASLDELSPPYVIATSLPAARALLDGSSFDDGKKVSRWLAGIRMLPLVCVHIAYRREFSHLDGFGCLFSREEGVRSLGVLFEQSIFGDRSVDHLERWILGGATDDGIGALSDEDLFRVVREDRKKLFGVDPEAEGMHVTRAIPAIPHYDLRLEEVLRSAEMERLRSRGIFLMGNYMGKLGLSGILEDAENLPMEVEKVIAA